MTEKLTGSLLTPTDNDLLSPTYTDLLVLTIRKEHILKGGVNMVGVIGTVDYRLQAVFLSNPLNSTQTHMSAWTKNK